MTTSLITNQVLLQRVGGVLTIIMGLAFIGFIPALQRQAKFTPKQLSSVAGAPRMCRTVSSSRAAPLWLSPPLRGLRQAGSGDRRAGPSTG